MCGRFALAVRPEDVEEEFSMIRIEWFPPRYNIAPTQPILVVRAEKGERRPALVRWGLVPSWAKDISSLPLFFNARSETAAVKPAFRGAFRHRRCLIPASGFYEWQKLPDGAKGPRKQPFYLKPTSERLVAFAGLWDEWADANGNLLDSATILTTAANDDLSALHDRMPVVVDPADYDRWLGLGGEAGEDLQAMLRPAPAGTFEAVPVDPRVNSARFDDPSLIERAEAVAAPPEPELSAEPAAPAQLKLL